MRTINQVKGSSAIFQKVGKGTASTKPTNGIVPVMNLDHSNVECLLQDYYAGDWIDRLDELKTNIDERQVIASAGASALDRKTDEFIIDANGEVTLDISHSVHLLSSFGGALTVNLPKAETAVGVEMTVKKIDSSQNVITVSEDQGLGPDSRNYYLGSENDYVTMISNGAEWFVTASNRTAGNTRYYDGTGIYDIDLSVNTYLVSSFGGVLEARLPPANAPEAIGRTVTIKKIDVSSNLVNISELGGSGPDGFTQPLNGQYKAITVVSDGAQWYITSKF